MAKRKTDPTPVATPPRQTRSSARLAGSSLNNTTPVSPNKRQKVSSPVADQNGGTSGSDDEINLLVRQEEQMRATTPCQPSSIPMANNNSPVRPCREIMDGVIITTPKHLTRSDTAQWRSDQVDDEDASSPYERRPRYSPLATTLSARLLETPCNGARPSSSIDPSSTDRHQSSRSRLEHSPPSFSPSASFSHSCNPLVSTFPVKSTTTASPRRRSVKGLPSHLIPHFHSQKRTLLHALQHPPLVEYDQSPYPSVHGTLVELLKGTIERNEGNSCLILGPKGSGKTRLLNQALETACSSCAITPVVVRLSAFSQTNDRLAMQEIARQIHFQLGPSVALPDIANEEEAENNDDVDDDLRLPPSVHLPAMIAALPRLGRPIVIVLDAFDGFAGHARQALLYCLLDTVQSCRSGSVPATATADDDRAVANDDNVTTGHSSSRRGEHGLIVIGLTSRIDCVTLLEKRVKSRFSHRIMRIGTPPTFDVYLDILKTILTTRATAKGTVSSAEWEDIWSTSIQDFLSDRTTIKLLKETFAFGKDLRVSPVICLTPSSPWLAASQLSSSISVQRPSKQFPFLASLPYPHVALLIAAAHTQTSGHQMVNFEILYDKFINQVRISASAPVQSERGGGLGMVNVARGVMFKAFEELVAHQVFKPVAAPSTHVTKEFVKYLCHVNREDIKDVVERLGQTNLKKWYHKNQ